MSLPPSDWTEEDALGFIQAEEEPVAWEDPNRPVLVALIATLGRILLKPKRFFADLPLTGGLGEPLGFALLVGTTGMLSSFFWQLLQDGSLADMLPRILAQYLHNVMENPQVIAGIFLLLPLVVILGQFGFSVCLLGAVRLTGPGTSTFEGVFRLGAYAQASAVICLVPWGGAFVAGFWNLFLLVIGLSQKFSFSTIKAVFTLFLATIFQGVLVALLLLLSGALGLWGLFFS